MLTHKLLNVSEFIKKVLLLVTPILDLGKHGHLLSPFLPGVPSPPILVLIKELIQLTKLGRFNHLELTSHLVKYANVSHILRSKIPFESL